MNVRRKLWLLAIGVSLSTAGFAQQEAIDKYLKTAQDNAVIYNGELEKVYSNSLYLNRPYLENEEYAPGDMVYNGNKYDGLNFRYNLFKEQLVVLSPKNKIGVNLDMRKISRFTIKDKQFVHYKELPVGIPDEGYWQLLLDGPRINLLLKRKCLFRSSEIHNNVSYSSFRFKNKYYLLADGKYYSFTGRSVLYKLYPSYKKQLKKYSREQSLDFRTDYEHSSCVLIEYLQSLITQTGK